MPRAGAELQAAATVAQECVFIPGLGGALVPTVEPFGPECDQGWAALWQAYAAEPYPTHRVEALDLGQVELSLRTELADRTEELLAAGATPFGAPTERGLGRVRAAQDEDWGLPPGMPGRAARLISLAGTVLTMADAGLDPALESVDLASTLSLIHI